MSSPLQVVLSDMHLAGVTDAVADSPFDFYAGKIFNPFEGAVDALPSANQTPVVKSSDVSLQIETAADIQPLEELSAKMRPVSDLVWTFGPKNADVQVVLSTMVSKENHPLSTKAKSLFERMLQAIGLKESAVSYVVLNKPEKFNKLEKAAVLDFLNELSDLPQNLFVGEESVRAVFDQTLIRMRQQGAEFKAKPCGLVMHPESLLAQPALKKLAWQDLLKFSNLLNGGVV